MVSRLGLLLLKLTWAHGGVSVRHVAPEGPYYGTAAMYRTIRGHRIVPLMQ